MVKVNVGTMSAQVSSVSSIVSQRVAALTSAKQSLSSFSNQEGLEGAAYQNAKSYASSVMAPLIDGMILLSEETEKGVTKLQTLYAEKCGSESLDSEVLTAKIEDDEELLRKIQDLKDHLDKNAKILSHAFDGLEARVKARLRKNRKKLKNLMEFNAESTSVFNDLMGYSDAVSSGLTFVSKGFSGFNGQFFLASNLDWIKTIKTGMEVRKEAKAKELKKKKAEESKKVSKIESATKESHVSVDKKKLLKEAKEAYKSGEIKKDTYESIVSGLTNASAALLKEVAKSKLTDTAVEKFTQESWEQLSKNLQTMQYSAVLVGANGANYSSAIDVNPSYANFIRGSSQFVKYGAPVLGAAIDFGTQVKGGEDVGDAAIKTGAHTAIAYAGAVIGGPVGFIIGVGVSMAFDFLYDNYKDDVVNSVSEFTGNIGDSVKDFQSNLGSALN